MTWAKNTASNIPFVLINASTGAALTGAAVTVRRTIDGGAQASASGNVAELGNGQYDFAPAAADLNGNVIGFLITATNAIPVHVTVKTDTVDQGQGAVVVSDDYGGGDYSYSDDGTPVDNATIYAYLTSDYDAGNLAPDYVQAKTTTDVNGEWVSPMNLDPGTYTLYYFKQGSYGPDTQSLVVT